MQISLEQFPMKTPRQGQLECVEFILNKFEEGKRFIFIEAPTGAGKSAIAVAVANHFKKSYYITIQKMLQDQLCSDFGENGKHGQYMIDLKGRNAYECTYKLDSSLYSSKQIEKWESTKPHNAADGHCRRKGKAKYDQCLNTGICDYFNQRDKAILSNICLMNFSSFLFQLNYTKQFTKRDLLIIDEGHNIESQLMNFVSLILTDSLIKEQLPVYANPIDYAEWFDSNSIHEKLKNRLHAARAAENVKEIDELESAISKLDYFMAEAEKGNIDNWIVEYEKRTDVGKVIFKPIYVKDYAEKLLFSNADRVLILSATILDVNVMAKSLGINREDLAAKRMSSTFPSKNHPIKYLPVVKVTGGKGQIDRWGPPIIKAVDKICSKYPDDRGIIHTHNFYIAEMLINECSREVRKRLLFQKDFRDKSHMIEFHCNEKNSIIIAPAMHEGVDLKDDLSRFQIICKIPFPNHFEDKQLAARVEDDPKFYEWITALKLIQSVGRSVRSADDFADTYIIDKSFEWWYKKNKSMIPSWFRNSLVGFSQT